MSLNISPKAIYDIVDRKVVGQHDAKKAVATALFLHIVRFVRTTIRGEVPAKKSDLMLLGPSGVGKTYIVRESVKAVRELLKLEFICPLLEVDATELSAPGWKGDDLSSLIADHCKNDLDTPARIDTTVVFIDEFDKLALPGVGQGGTDHNRNTQYNLLKMMEGTTVRSDTSALGPQVEVDTGLFLFILAGNFAEVRAKRKDNAKPGVGFLSSDSADSELDLIQELDDAGVATQILGRTSHVAELKPLTKKQLMEVLEIHLIPEYKETFSFLDVNMRVTKVLKEKIVDKAIERGTGARGLQTDLAAYAEDKLFNAELNLIDVLKGE